MNMGEYEDEIIGENLQELVWGGLWRCKACGNGCSPGVDKTMLKKEFKSLCHGIFYANRNWIWFYDPDEAAVKGAKRLLELEKRAREAKVRKRC